MRRVLALALTFVALPLAMQSGANAQSRFSQPTQQNAETRFRGMDVNNDGIISRSEWRGTVQSFNEHDWNRDGMLSGDEIRVGVPRSTRSLADDDFDNNSDRFYGWTAANFTTLDRNRDGRIAANEWAYDRQAFIRVDSNRDGVLSRAEFIGTPTIDDDRDDRLEFLDGNNDGRVERREWHGSGEAFNWLDRNNDDVLSRNELANEPLSVTEANDRFARLDFNRNGRLEANEWQASRSSFDIRDTNRDGILSRAEFNGTAPANPSAGSRPVATGGQIVRVAPKMRWTDTGLNVEVGDRITFDAEGTMELSEGNADSASAAGSRTGRRAPNAPLAQEVAGALIARIGDSTPILIGAQRTLQRAPVSGRLYLGVNDDHLDDNSGEFRVSVTISRR